VAYDPETSKLLWQQAEELAPPRGSEPKRAVERLKQALDKDPRNVFAHSSLARLYLQLGELDKAEASCISGLAVDNLPDELRTILAHVPNPLEQKADDFKFYLFKIRLTQGRRADAEALLPDLKKFSELHGKGRYERAMKLLKDPTSSGSAPEAKSGCFIATAVLGTRRHDELALLCAFRDDILLPSGFGKQFVKAYYRLSPPVAKRLERSRFASSVVRGTLIAPMGWLLRKCWRRNS
jgi:tetratricopeptide (TPR) repeat protein